MAPKRKQQQQPQKAAAPKRAIEVFQLDCEAFTTPTKSARRTRSAEDNAKRTVNANVVDFKRHMILVFSRIKNYNSFRIFRSDLTSKFANVNFID